MPVAARPSAWAHAPAEYLTRALKLRDEYKAHPSITTAFAPLHDSTLDNATLARISTLAAELDAGIVIGVNRARHEIDECGAVTASGRWHGSIPSGLSHRRWLPFMP